AGKFLIFRVALRVALSHETFNFLVVVLYVDFSLLPIVIKSLEAAAVFIIGDTFLVPKFQPHVVVVDLKAEIAFAIVIEPLLLPKLRVLYSSFIALPLQRPRCVAIALRFLPGAPAPKRRLLQILRA